MNGPVSTVLLDVFFCFLAALLAQDPRFDDAPTPLSIELPPGAGATGTTTALGSPLEFALRADGTLESGGRAVEWAALSAFATDAFRRGAQEVVLHADRRAPVGAYTLLVSELRAAGFHTVRIPVQSPRSDVPPGFAPVARKEGS